MVVEFHLPSFLGTPLNVMITPYGEALRLRCHTAALAEISAAIHVQRSAYKLTPLFR